MSTTISYSDDALVLTTDKGKVVKEKLFDALSSSNALKAIEKELSAQTSASEGSVSLLNDFLLDGRMISYAGKRPLNETTPREARDSLKDTEDALLRPLVVATIKAPKEGCTPEETTAYQAKCELVWRERIGKMRAGGSYANARSVVLSFYTATGERPVRPNGKLLTVAAMQRILVALKEGLPKEEDQGVAGKLRALALTVRERTEKTVLGSPADAVVALREMLATFEGLERELAEQLSTAPSPALPSVGALTNAALAKAQSTAIPA